MSENNFTDNNLSADDLKSYAETTAAYKLMSAVAPDYTGNKYLENFSTLHSRLYNEVICSKQLILTGNLYVSALPSVRPVDPPGYFEAAMRNTSLLIDSTLGPIVGAATSLLSGTLAALGTGVSSLFGNPLSMLGIIVAGAAAAMIIPRIATSTKNENEEESSNVKKGGVNENFLSESTN